MGNFKCVAIDSVREFHARNQQLIGDPTDVNQEFPEQHRELRVRLILEELGEFTVAFHEKNLLLSADGLCDLLYVVLGTAVTAGVDFEVPFEHKQEYGPRVGIEAHYKLKVLRELTRHVNDVVLALSPTITTYNKMALQVALIKLCHAISITADVLGFPLQEMFFEVHASNLTKQLRGATDGKKYGEGVNAKGEGYRAPQLEKFLGLE